MGQGLGPSIKHPSAPASKKIPKQNDRTWDTFVYAVEYDELDWCRLPTNEAQVASLISVQVAEHRFLFCDCKLSPPSRQSSFKKKNYWSIVALQCCVNFCCKKQQDEWAIGVYASLFFGSASYLGHHRALSRVPCATRQALISDLLYTWSSICMAVPVSQFIPPHPAPPLCVHTFVLYVCVSISALQIAHLYHFSRFHISNIIWYLFFFFWLTSLCMTISQSLQLAPFHSF